MHRAACFVLALTSGCTRLNPAHTRADGGDLIALVHGDGGQPSAAVDGDAADLAPPACDPVRTATDLRNCGACGHDCTALAGVDGARVLCVDGACQIAGACLLGWADCAGGADDGCETDITTASHCGGCLTHCGGAMPLCAVDGAGYVCIGGGCPTGQHLCGTSCVADTSVSACGTQCLPCAAPAHATALCASGTCGFTCDSGYVRAGAGCSTATTASEWQSVIGPTRLWSVFGTDGHIFVVGDDGLIGHSAGDGHFLGQESNTTAPLLGVWVDAAGHNAYAVGYGGVILHSALDGKWTKDRSPTTNSLNGVWGSGASDLYAVGGAGTLLHGNGSGSWSAVSVPTTTTLYSAWGTGPGDVYATGTDGTFHSTSSGWMRLSTGGTLMMAISGFGSTVLSVGKMGTILSGNGGDSFVSVSTGTSDYWAVVVRSGDAFVVGEGGILRSVANGPWVPEKLPSAVATHRWVGAWGNDKLGFYAVSYEGGIAYRP